MPDNLLQTGGAGGIGAVLGVIMSFFGFKSKIEGIDTRVDKLTAVVQFATVCDARYDSLKTEIQGGKEMQKEMRDDIKTILSKLPQ